MLIGYARVSTLDWNLDLRIYAERTRDGISVDSPAPTGKAAA